MYLQFFSLLLALNTLRIIAEFPTDLFWISLTVGRSNVCHHTVYQSKKTSTTCWLILRCTKYKKESTLTKYCCPGWQNYFDDLKACTHPICNGRISVELYGLTACSQHYDNDYIMYRNQVKVRDSGGVCTSPGQCSHCADGFYANGAMCSICPKIDNCNHRRCTSPGDNICVYCDGEIKSKATWRAYTSAIDSGKSCRKACSWRSDSRRCYPGICSGETVDTCECVEGFTGQHCEQIINKTRILFNLIKLEDGSNVLTTPTNPSGDYHFPAPTVWTNLVRMTEVSANFDGEFKSKEPTQKPDVTGENHYVTDWKKGIVKGTIVLRLHRNNSVQTIFEKTNCPGTETDPVSINYKCGGNFTISHLDIIHDDVLEIELSALNGGYVEVMDRENSNKKTKHFLVGKTESRTFTYHFDTEPPYQPCAESGETGCVPPISAPEFTPNSSIIFNWNNWSDKQSHLHHYSYEVFDMEHNGERQSEKDMLTSGRIPLSNESVSFEVYRPGMYSILFVAFDVAGNRRVARHVFLFDDISKVEKQLKMVPRVREASEETDYTWVSIDVNAVTFEFKDIFVNSRHVKNHWLDAVKPYSDVGTMYDDRFGDRTIKMVDNVNGIVDFQVSFQVNATNMSTRNSRPLTSIRNTLSQAGTITVDWEDGDRLDLVVRAIDVMGKYDEDTIFVFRDASPPVVENLWLTRGNRTNIYVHNVEDFTEMTVEWDAFDYNSGIISLNWTFFDNFTGSVVLHGTEDLMAQGNTHDLSTCQAKYGGQPGHCYCTSFWGCFHKHFTVTPQIKAGAGLVVGKDRGTHDYDYYIQVQVMNTAKLVTSHIKKITIDVSPPHAGGVHDGTLGTLEVDYQQSKTLHAHWDGFFDRESGVLFYLYTFKESCQNSTSMVPASKNPNVVETTLSYATHTVTTEGTYYVTVVAFNRALDPSEPVCSDGVTIDTATPSVKEVLLQNARIRGGLITNSDRTNVWVLGNDTIRRLLVNVTDGCKSKATVLDDVNIYPLERDEKGNLTSFDGKFFCKNTTRAPKNITVVLPKSSSIILEWLQSGKESAIFDYEIGLTSTVTGGVAPDLMEYVSTRQHQYLTLRHADIPVGLLFYFAIKTTSQAQVEAIQMIGPCIMDTTPPDHNGVISVTVSGNHMVASWSAGDFQDIEEFYGLVYHFGIGSEPYGTDIQSYEILKEGGACVLTSPPTCTAAAISELAWQLHGHHYYYVTLKVENSAGLSTLVVSRPYIHDVQLPSKGIVMDIPVGSNKTDDVDFQTDTTTVAARWYGFVHPHLNVTYRVSVGTIRGGKDVSSPISTGTNSFFNTSGLNLMKFKTYYVTVEAVTTAGSINVSSDGITIVKENAVLSGVKAYDGKPCTTKMAMQTFQHVDNGNITDCHGDVDYQPFLNSLQVYWIVPNHMAHYTPDAHWAVQIRFPATNHWILFRDFQHISGGHTAAAHDFFLSPGRTYRSVIKLCALSTCYHPVYTNGVTILSNKPQGGSLELFQINTPNSEDQQQVRVRMDRFYDPDVHDEIQMYEAIDRYEWTLKANSNGSAFATKWKFINASEITVTGISMAFDISVEGAMDTSRCKAFSVRGYNKADLWTVVTADINSCSSFAKSTSNVVIDAVGDVDHQKDYDGKGWYAKQIFLATNDDWLLEDVDYTPYINYISAVWPSLKHGEYKYAVLRIISTDEVISSDLSANRVALSDPCSHPKALAKSCGNTNQKYVNIMFNPGDLNHGERYIVCVLAQATTREKEKATQLPETSACSDGIVVDLIPPVAGNVWIGQDPGILYQTTNTHISINWSSFMDVEEHGTKNFGIKSYIVGVGSSPGSNDIVAFKDVGITTHIILNNLQLQNGHMYYATVTGTDFVGHSTTKVSNAVIVDTTPPLKTNTPITINGRHITSISEVSSCWDGVFTDQESGIRFYEWSVGSQPGYDNVMAYVNVGELTCAVSNRNYILDLHEGHVYYISVKAYNGAGLYTVKASLAYIVDITPPIAGHVYDGKRDVNPSYKKDSDFQTDTSYIGAFWEGFNDPHSTLMEYRVSIGTCKQCQDILTDQSVGIVKEFILPKKNFRVGVAYYITVTACNTADLCTTVTSDGVILDDTPPVPGVVYDGTEKQDINYQSARTFIAAKWYGFVDPQSGLDKYEWWAGTSPGSDDVMPRKILHLTEFAVNTRISLLPLHKMIYVSVRAYNKAGQYSQATSNGFKMDITPPLITRLLMSPDVGSITPNTLISGIARDYLFTNLDLQDGVKYYVNLIACNGAKMCSHSQSSAILVDSSPPSRGMFAIKSDHAAEVKRQVAGYMTWRSRSVYLSWLGFADAHSNIAHYMVAVGTTYMANDLIKNSKPYTRVDHSVTGEKFNEGQVQTAIIDTVDLKKVTGGLYITMWAVNSVGLSSPIIHSMFHKIPGGSLELVRRCKAYSCMGHCVCAPQDQLCPSQTECKSNVSADARRSKVVVKDIVDLNAATDATFTPTDMCLSAKWDVSLFAEFSPIWYEWSVGFSSEASPEGIFNHADERVWHDAGKNGIKVFTLPKGTSLHNGVRYSFFVRAWYSKNTFAIFKSSGITISKENITGRSTHRVIEYSLDGTRKKDMDAMKYFPFAISWKNAFSIPKDQMDKFRLYISTYPGGHDVYKIATDVSQDTDFYELRRFKERSRVTYYSNVVAFSKTGAHCVESSDGFLIDDSLPKPGFVYDGTELHDSDYQRSVEIVSASWHGFVDLGTGIKSYYWCVGFTTTTSECEVKAWLNVGLKTSVTSTIQVAISHGSVIYNKVYAVDDVGHVSQTAVSDGIKIDTTPPVAEEMVHHEMKNLALNPSFEMSGGKTLTWFESFSADICSLEISYHPFYWQRSPWTCSAVVTSDINLAKTGRSMLILRGSLTQIITGLEPNSLYRIRFVASHLPSNFSKFANKEGFIEFGGQQYVFLLYTNGFSDKNSVSWHLQTFYFHATSSEDTVIIGCIGEHGEMLLDDVQIHRVVFNETGKPNIHSHFVFLHDWGSIHGSWSFVEDDSNIIDYQWGIGYTHGGTQIQPFESVGQRKFAYKSRVKLKHKTKIFITVIATNSAGLQAVFYSQPVLVDLTGPSITEVNDGHDHDLDSWEPDDVVVNWKAGDEESGTKFCEWAIGTQPLGNEIQTFTKIDKGVTKGIVRHIGYHKVAGMTVYSSIRCENYAGLQSVKSSDGVRISKSSPDVQHADLQYVGLSDTEYGVFPGFQSVVNQIRLIWTGFTDSVGIERYTFAVGSRASQRIYMKMLSNNQEYTYVRIDKLALTDGYQDLTVLATNFQFISSPVISRHFTVLKTKPYVNASRNFDVLYENSTQQCQISWKKMFSSEYRLYYEVSAGKVLGGGDILKWMETTDTSVTFGFPLKKKTADVDLYVTVRAISPSGIFAYKSGNITFP